MVLIEDSLSVVLVGDWNKLYIQPDWMAQHIFEKKELEIGVNGQGSEFSVLYRGNGIIVTPGQDKMVFSAINMDSDTIGNLCKCLNNFIEKAFTTQLYAYGLNVDFIEDGGTVFAEVLDSMADTNAIIESGYVSADKKKHVGPGFELYVHHRKKGTVKRIKKTLFAANRVSVRP